MEVDFVIAISVFIFIIAFVAIYITNYLSAIQVDILEYREKASEIIERMFSSPTEEDIYINPKVVEKIKRIPFVIKAKNHNFTNEIIAFEVLFDKDCKNLVWNSTIRIYDENLNEVPIKISHQKFCNEQFLNASIITAAINISENSIKRFFIYFSDDKGIVAKNYENFNLISYYKLDENYGVVAKDFSGNENSAILKNDTEACFNNGCPTWIEGKFNYALFFDGVNDYLDCSNLSGKLKTIEFFIKPKNSNDEILQLSSSVNITLENYAIKVGGVNSSIIYVNGIINGTVELDKWNYVLITTNESIEIINCKIGMIGNDFYNGAIDEIRFWNITKNEDYALARNSSSLDFRVYPEEEIEIVSSRRLNQIRILPYDYVRGLLELNYRLRLEIVSQS